MTSYGQEVHSVQSKPCLHGKDPPFVQAYSCSKSVGDYIWMMAGKSMHGLPMNVCIEEWTETCIAGYRPLKVSVAASSVSLWKCSARLFLLNVSSRNLHRVYQLKPDRIYVFYVLIMAFLANPCICVSLLQPFKEPHMAKVLGESRRLCATTAS